jgi:hypothetical protein
MEHRGGRDVPVNNLLVRSGPARSASHRMLVSQRPGIIRSRLSLTGWPRFLRHFHDRGRFAVRADYKSFAIMKHLARCCSWNSHPPPWPHSARIPGAFTAGHLIVGLYLPYCEGKGPR